MKQPSQSSTDAIKKPRQSRKQQLLSTMEQLIPWSDWLSKIATHYLVTDSDRRPALVESLLRIYLLQQWFGYSDSGIEDALHDMPLLCDFARIHADQDGIPDETAVRHFRHLLESHGLAETFTHHMKVRLTEQGLLFNAGNVIDATLKDEAGKPEQFVSICTEISNLKRAQQQVMEQHEELMATVRAIPDLLFEMDTDGRFLKVRNPNPESMSLQENQFLGKTANEVLPAEAAKQMLLALNIAADQGHCQGMEIQLTLGDSQKWFELYIATMGKNLGKQRFVVISRDISDRKEKEQKLLDTHAELTQNAKQLLDAKNAAEQANQTKSEFLANMSHELRTPMHAILSFADLGRKKVNTAPADKLETYFQRIQQSGESLLSLLNDLLDLTRLESGKMELSPNSQNLQDLAADAIAELGLLAQEKGLHVELMASENNLLANVDASRYSQVIRNILANAIKFSPVGGHIILNLFRSQLAEKEAVTLEVADNGIGIPAEELETIFDKFVQSSKTKTGAGGTGLGLAICREIVEAHGGKMTAGNSLTGGAVFTVSVPIK